jgi:hypothetical protein
VHDAGWQIARLEDGTVEWTSPTGHSYRVPPATYPIDTTSQRPAPAAGEDQNDHTPEPERPSNHGPGEDQTDHGPSGPGETDEPRFWTASPRSDR